MESKTKKSNAKSAKKTTKVKEVKEVKTNGEVIVKNQIDYTKILNKLYVCLIVIACLLAINIIVNIVKGGSISSSSSKTTEETVENEDYDVSSFDQVTTTEAIEKIKKGGTEVIYIGSPTCGYCVKFLPVLKEAQEKLGYKTTYIDLEQVTSEDQEKLVALDDYISENFGYTPMVLVFKKGKYVDGWVGYSEYDAFASFLSDAGIK